MSIRKQKTYKMNIAKPLTENRTDLINLTNPIIMSNNYKGNNIAYSQIELLLMNPLRFILVIILIGLLSENAIAKDWAWVRQGDGGDPLARSNGNDVATDENGNVYVAGYSSATNTIAFGNIILTNSGAGDIFLVKYDSIGNVLWAKSIGGSGADQYPAIAIDTSGNVFITGSTNSTDFPTLNPGGGSYFQSTLSGSTDAFIAKYNKSGTLLWSTYYGGTGGDAGYGIATDKNCNLFIGGSTFSSDFPVQSAFQATWSGSSEAFIIKFDNNGSRIWSTFYGGTGYDRGYKMATDIYGNIFISGYTYSVNLPVSTTAFQKTINGSADVFVAKFNAIGSMVWATYFGGTKSDVGNGIAIDVKGNILITGQTSSSNMPIGTGAYQSKLLGVDNAFLLKLNNNGNFLWSTYVGSISVSGNAITTDKLCNIYMTGRIEDTTKLDGLVAFVAKHDSSGNYHWMKKPTKANFPSGYYYHQGLGITTDPFNNLYVTGVFMGTSTFGTDTLLMKGDTSSVYIAKLLYNNPKYELYGVWPGDANRDLVANNNDLLAIGVGYNSIGPLRPGANISWTSQQAMFWGPTLSNGKDYCNTDCNGDGTINHNDTTAIVQNYGLTHILKTAAPIYQSGLPDLQVQFPMDTIYPGQALSLPVNLGDNGNLIAAIYGLAYTINFNSKDIDTSKIKMRYTTSWLANGSGNLLSIQKVWGKQGQLDIAVTRTSHTNISGYGQIGTLDIVMKDDIVPKLASTFTKKFQLDITSVKAIKVDETPVFLNALKDSVIIKVYQVMTGINNSIGADEFVVYPNPATEKLIIRSAGIISKVELMNSLGQQILATGVAADNFVTLETGAVLPGIYYLAVSTNKGRFVQRVCIER